MFKAQPSAKPIGSLLEACEEQGAFTDCYRVQTNSQISLPELIKAFYTSAPFKVERTILKWVLGRASADIDAECLAQGVRETFAIWKVEERTANQLLLAELSGRTKSWLMVQPSNDQTANGTNLYFGSAVMPKKHAGSKTNQTGAAFHSLLWFHKLYSQILLAAAERNLSRGHR